MYNYKKAYGIIETLAPLHVGAASGEESGNLNLIFRDQFTQTGIIPSSSLRGRLRSDMYLRLKRKHFKKESEDKSEEQVTEEVEQSQQETPENKAKEQATEEVKQWYGRGAEANRRQNYEYESIIKPEHASILWLPVFCPSQPIVWVSCPSLLERYKRINQKIPVEPPNPYTGSTKLLEKITRKNARGEKVLFFNLGFLTIKEKEEEQKKLSHYFPLNKTFPAVVVDDNDMGMIHDMALYRQSRVQLEDDRKIAANKAFFNVEALPEGTFLVFPLAIRPTEDRTWDNWQPLEKGKTGDIYLGGLESIGFGHCTMTLQEIEEAGEGKTSTGGAA